MTRRKTILVAGANRLPLRRISAGHYIYPPDAVLGEHYAIINGWEGETPDKRYRDDRRRRVSLWMISRMTPDRHAGHVSTLLTEGHLTLYDARIELANIIRLAANKTGG